MDAFIADLPPIPERVELVDSLRELVRLASKDWACQMADGTVIEHPSLRRARELIGE